MQGITEEQLIEKLASDEQKTIFEVLKEHISGALVTNRQRLKLIRALEALFFPVTGPGEFCCDVMQQQLTNHCVQHGKECPDNVVQAGEHTGIWYLVAGNADYAFKFCPWCRREIPKANQWDAEKVKEAMDSLV